MTNNVKSNSHDGDKSPIELRTTGSPAIDVEENYIFLDLMTKSTIIVFIYCIQPIIVDLFWYLEHRGRFLSILVPLNMVSLNMVIDAFCILLFNKFGQKYYDYICKCDNKRCAKRFGQRGCHFCCQGCCKSIAKCIF